MEFHSKYNIWELCAVFSLEQNRRPQKPQTAPALIVYRLEPFLCFLEHLNTITANISSKTGLIMIGVIIGSRKVGINPDNVATPIAASLGDLITLALLSGISTGLYQELGE